MEDQSNADSAGKVSDNHNTSADSGGCAGACNAVGTSTGGFPTQRQEYLFKGIQQFVTQDFSRRTCVQQPCCLMVVKM